jgi:hypothetical protein
MTFEEFGDAVAARLLNSAGDSSGRAITYDKAARKWRRGRLTVTLSCSAGSAYVTYVATDEGGPLGHSSSAFLPHAIDGRQVDLVAKEVISLLSNRFLFETR